VATPRNKKTTTKTSHEVKNTKKIENHLNINEQTKNNKKHKKILKVSSFQVNELRQKNNKT